MKLDDFIISIAYFSIPLQLVVSLYKYPRLASMPIRVVILCLLFALFILFCGAGHLMRSLGQMETTAFLVLNWFTSMISVATALYLLPLVPNLMSELDSSLQHLRKLIEETDASKRQLFTFMSFLCHEIRNPLFAITANIEFAQDMDMTHELRESLQCVSQSANLMLRLVNDVLDLSKIESGKLELEEREFDMREFFRSMACTMERQIKARHQGRVEFYFNMANSLPRFVKTDSVRLLQIAYNILSNACKFTEVGAITFSVSLLPAKKEEKETHCSSFTRSTLERTDMGESSDSVHDTLLENSGDEDGAFSMALLQDAEEGLSSALSIEKREDADMRVLKMTFEDTGSGISPEHLERIFQPYAQSKLSDFRKHGGTGLGLSIIKRLLDIMGGSVKVSSAENEGTKFVILLPVMVPKDQQLKRRGSFAKADHVVDDTVVPAKDDATESSTSLAFSEDNLTFRDTLEARLIPDAVRTGPPSNLKNESAPLFAMQDPMVPAAIVRPLSPPPVPNQKLKLAKFQFAKNTNVVLVVDDNAVNRKLIGKMLSFFNLEYQTAEDGKEAVEIMKQSRNITGDYAAPHFGLVYCDLSMPVMDGYEAIATIRSLGKGCKWLPIVALTANAMAEEKRKALEAGATEFTTKPILRNVLHSTCQQHLGPTQTP